MNLRKSDQNVIKVGDASQHSLLAFQNCNDRWDAVGVLHVHVEFYFSNFGGFALNALRVESLCRCFYFQISCIFALQCTPERPFCIALLTFIEKTILPQGPISSVQSYYLMFISRCTWPCFQGVVDVKIFFFNVCKAFKAKRHSQDSAESLSRAVSYCYQLKHHQLAEFLNYESYVLDFSIPAAKFKFQFLTFKFRHSSV